jgi:hypothetical protein
MVIMAGMPIAFLIGFWMMKVTYRVLDAGFYCCKSQITTKKTSQKQFKDLWSGVGYVMFSQYASVSVQVFVSFIYGPAIPVLFIITFFSLIIMYVFERLNLAYWHPKPPMYEKAMNEQVLKILKWAPMGMMLSLYWLLGNNQMFGNELSIKEQIHNTQDPMHPLITFTGGLKADHMILVLIPVYLLFKLAYNLLQVGKHKWDEDFNLDEDLGTYWESLSGSNQKVMYATEVYYRNMF